MENKQAKHPAYPDLLRSLETELQRDLDLYAECAQPNIENYVGTARVPVGLAGPVSVRGDKAQGEFFIPMATTEGTLVASTSRGMKVINASGGARVRVINNGGIQRAPVFEFESMDDACDFTTELNNDWSWLVPVLESTTSHGKVIEVRCWQMARLVCMRVSMDSGDASGQNMVSIATQKAVIALREKYPIIKRHLMAGGVSGEKVASNINVLEGRGKSVVVSVQISGDVLAKITRAAMKDIVRLHSTYSNFAQLAGNSNSHHSHSNVLAAIYIATGQDPATLPEAAFAQNVLRHDVENDTLLWEASLPNVNVGTVGGGTNLPTQKECLEIMGCHGSGNVEKFAELCAVTSLANEISFWGSVCAEEWVGAHADLKHK